MAASTALSLLWRCIGAVPVIDIIDIYRAAKLVMGPKLAWRRSGRSNCLIGSDSPRMT
jgi:hypothetical protein